MNTAEVKAKGWLTSKTNIIAIVVVIAGVLQQVSDANILPAKYQGVLVTVVGVIMFGMRMITKAPVSTNPITAETKTVEIVG